MVRAGSLWSDWREERAVLAGGDSGSDALRDSIDGVSFGRDRGCVEFGWAEPIVARPIPRTEHMKTSMPPIIVPLLVLSVILVGCQTGASDTAPKGAQAQSVGAIPGITGTVFQYDDNVYRGGDIQAQEGMDELKALGIKTIFSVTPTDDERRFAAQAGMRLVEVPFTKAGIPEDLLPTYLAQLEGAKKPFYAHCHSGNNRGGALLAAYRIHLQDWDHERAKAEFVSLGGKDTDYPALLESVRKE